MTLHCLCKLLLSQSRVAVSLLQVRRREASWRKGQGGPPLAKHPASPSAGGSLKGQPPLEAEGSGALASPPPDIFPKRNFHEQLLSITLKK